MHTADPFKAKGKPHVQRVHEDNRQLDDAHIVLEKTTKMSFNQINDLASVWCECDEPELRHENYDQACGCCGRRQHCLPVEPSI